MYMVSGNFFYHHVIIDVTVYTREFFSRAISLVNYSYFTTNPAVEWQLDTMQLAAIRTVPPHSQQTKARRLAAAMTSEELLEGLSNGQCRTKIIHRHCLNLQYSRSRFLKYLSSFGCRHILALVGFFGSICNLMHRVDMSVAIVCMTVDSTPPRANVSLLGHGLKNNNTSLSTLVINSTIDSDLQQCPNSPKVRGLNFTTGEFEWDRRLRGYILSSFYVGYLSTQIFGGILAAKWSAKWTILSGMAVNTVGAFLSPLSAQLSPWFLATLRVVQGAGQGFYLSAYMQLWSEWAPTLERSKLVGFVFAGNSVGGVIGFFLSGMICVNFGWQWIFYIYGFLCVIWMIFWVFLAFDSPQKHPRITEKERNLIQSSNGSKVTSTEKTSRIPWLKLLTSSSILCMILVYFCALYAVNNALSSLAQYMNDVMKFDIKQNGVFSSLPPLCKFISTIAIAYIVDYIRSKAVASNTTIRKITQACGLFPAAVLFAVVGFLSCHEWQGVVVILCLIEALGGFHRSGLVPNTLEVAPRFAGIIMGVTNTSGTLAGVLAPIITGQLVRNGTQEEWRRVFFLTSALQILGAIGYLLFAKAEKEPWAEEEDDEWKDEDKAKAMEMTTTRATVKT